MRTAVFFLTCLLSHLSSQGIASRAHIPRKGGDIQLRLIQYHNFHGKDSEKDACDVSIFTKNRCDFFFQVEANTITQNHGEKLKGFKTHTYNETNLVNFKERLNGDGLSNPVVWLFSRWFGVFNYKILVYDDDFGYSNHDHVDTFKGTIRAKADGATHRKVLRGDIHKRDSKLTLEITIRCHKHFYDDGCQTYCFPRNDDVNGHYLCNKQGHKVCRPGYRDAATSCKEGKLCRNNPCKNEGQCRQLSESKHICECLDGFEGPSCAKISSASRSRSVGERTDNGTLSKCAQPAAGDRCKKCVSGYRLQKGKCQRDTEFLVTLVCSLVAAVIGVVLVAACIVFCLRRKRRRDYNKINGGRKAGSP